jgi:hypothetical protein
MSKTVSELMDKHVNWYKLAGKANASMIETRGFGNLYWLKLDTRMIISGDYGVTTSAISSITEMNLGIVVCTKNSVYLIEEA